MLYTGRCSIDGLVLDHLQWLVVILDGDVSARDIGIELPEDETG